MAVVVVVVVVAPSLFFAVTFVLPAAVEADNLDDVDAAPEHPWFFGLVGASNRGVKCPFSCGDSDFDRFRAA